MQDTLAFASQAIGHALGVSAIVTTPANGPRAVDAILSAEFDRLQSGSARVSAQRVTVQVTAADFDTASVRLADWAGGSVEFLEGPLEGETLEVANAKPDAEGVGVTLVLKRVG
ncbi:MAG: hypothetical protein OEW52_00055 [Thermoleophilia bacterium]|nr:hypothetical protein [Thermoleophilia bacterium]